MNPKILVIDDDLHVRKMLSFVFKENGYDDITTVEDYYSALPLISEKNFDVIFCDIMMQGKTGIDFLQQMNDRRISTPVILITGQPNLDTAIAALRLGAFDYIQKPITGKILIGLTEKALKFKEERERADRRAEENKSRLDHIINTYRHHLETLQNQISSAVDIYRNLMDLRQKHFKLNMSWQHHAAAQLGGDFIDIRETQDISDILVADVAGHDMGASYHTILLKAFFEENCHKGNDGMTLFRLLNRHLLESSKEERMITGVFIRIHLETLHGEIVSAAHSWIVLLRKDEPETEHPLKFGGNVLGMNEHADFGYRDFSLAPGDRLFVFTDGVLNASQLDKKTGRKIMLTAKDVDQLFIKHRNAGIEDTVERVWKDIMAFCRNKPKDDMLLFGLEA